MKTTLLVPIELPPDHMARLTEHYEVIHVREGADWLARTPDAGLQAEGLLTRGSIGLSESQLASMPRLRIVCCLGAGFENVDLEAMRKRGVVVTSGSGANRACVADHAMGLLLAAMRGIARFDRDTREGLWQANVGMPGQVSGKTLGILGLGSIGMEIAHRAAAFSMPILYCNRQPRHDCDWTWVADARTLASRSDILVCLLPGGEQTRHLVNEQVLDALGPQGCFVNVSRGSVVDTDALVRALQEGRIRCAGLDVYEDEPAVDPRLVKLSNVVLTPHIAGRSAEARLQLLVTAMESFRAFFGGRPVLNLAQA